MAVTNETAMPSDAELTVQEIALSTPYLKAVAVYMHRACEDKIREFMLRRAELEDPRATLKEGALVTACGVEFLQKLKTTCADETKRYADCIDHSPDGKLLIGHCREPQRFMDRCIETKFGIERPPLGYFTKLHVHESEQPRPAPAMRDYKAEAAKVLDELPEGYPTLTRKDYKRFRTWRTNFFES